MYRCIQSFLLITLLFFNSCLNRPSTDLAKKTDYSEYLIQDSIIINEPEIFLKAISKNHLLFVRPTNQDIVLFNKNLKKSNLFNVFGEGPKKSSYPLGSMKSIGFFDNSTIWISDLQKILYFDLFGNFKDEIKIENPNTYAPLSYLKVEDSIAYLFTIPQGFTNKLEFYKSKQTLFLKEDLKNGIQKRFFDFPPKDSHFFTDEYYLAKGSYFYVNYLKNKTATYLYSTEPTIYSIDLVNEATTKKAKFSPEYFAPLKVYFKDKPDNNRIFMQSYMGSFFTGHFIVDDINYAFYSIPYSEEFMVEYVKTHKNFPFEEAPEIKFALTVFDKDGKKLRDDIVFPTSLGKPLLMDEDGIIYFMKNPTEDDEKKGQTVYYKVRLTDEDS